jgi:hypothetical protein
MTGRRTHACESWRGREKEELRAEEGGRGPHLARGGDEVARVSAEAAEIVGAAEERRGGAGDGTECFGWVGWLPRAVSIGQGEPLLTECS